AVGGVGSDRGNLMFSAAYSEVNPIWAGDRNFSMIQRSIDWKTGKIVTVGSTATPLGELKTNPTSKAGDPSTFSDSDAWKQLVAQCPSGICTHSAQGGGWRDFADPADRYNFQPENYLSTPLSRYNLYSQGYYQFTDKIRAFFEGLYTNRTSDQ